MDYTDEMKKRLRRLEGQVKGILRMMDEKKDCKDVVAQLSAVRNAADKAIAVIVAVNLEQCLLEGQSKCDDTSKLVREAVELLVKSR